MLGVSIIASYDTHTIKKGCNNCNLSLDPLQYGASVAIVATDQVQCNACTIHMTDTASPRKPYVP